IEEITATFGTTHARTTPGFQTPPPEMPSQAGNQGTPIISALTPPPPPPIINNMPVHQGDFDASLQQEYTALQQAFQAKDAELTAFHASFQEIREQLAQVHELIESKDREIAARDSELEQVRSTMELIQGELKNKDNALFRSKAKIDVLEESVIKFKQESTISLKKLQELQDEKKKVDDELQALLSKSDDLAKNLETVSKGSESEIDQLRCEKFEINERLKTRMDEVEILTTALREKDNHVYDLQREIEALKGKINEHEKTPEKVKHFEEHKIIMGLDAIFETINGIVKQATHNVIITLPNIKDLEKIDLSGLKSFCKVNVATKINMRDQTDLDLYQKYTGRNVEFRSYDLCDRFGLSVDRCIVLIGVNSKREPFAIVTEDEDAIDLLVKEFIVQTWTLGRKL
nr:hypothetical protein [Candidatus Sigynarchaeota archaeon]